MTLHKTLFVEPNGPEDTRYRGGLWRFKRDDPDDDMEYVCNGDVAKVRILANQIIEKIDDLEVLKLIYDYAEAQVDNARGDWSEDEAGASL